MLTTRKAHQDCVMHAGPFSKKGTRHDNYNYASEKLLQPAIAEKRLPLVRGQFVSSSDNTFLGLSLKITGEPT